MTHLWSLFSMPSTRRIQDGWRAKLLWHVGIVVATRRPSNKPEVRIAALKGRCRVCATGNIERGGRLNCWLLGSPAETTLFLGKASPNGLRFREKVKRRKPKQITQSIESVEESQRLSWCTPLTFERVHHCGKFWLAERRDVQRDTPKTPVHSRNGSTH